MAESNFTEEVDHRIYQKLAKEIVTDLKSNECNEVSVNVTASVGHGKWCIEADFIVDFNLLLNQPNLLVTVNNLDLLEGRIVAPDDRTFPIDTDRLLKEIQELCVN